MRHSSSRDRAVIISCLLSLPSSLAFPFPSSSLSFKRSSLPFLNSHHDQPRAPASPSSASADSRAGAGQVKAGDFVCRTIGVCEPCPDGDTAPSCALYGARRPLLCISDSLPSTSSSSSSLPALALHPVIANPASPPPNLAAPPSPPDHNAHRPPPLIDPLAPKQGLAKPPSPPPTILHMAEEPLAAGKKQNSNSNPNLLNAPGLDPEPEGLDDEDVKDHLRGDRGALLEAVKGRRSGTVLEKREELRTWEACEKVVKKEREDFMEFILCNVVFAAISLSVLVARHRNLAVRQYSRLAARIGVVTV
ncbi:hypothetical protein RQP46_001585 [Phenoliferia psychrophenolica]